MFDTLTGKLGTIFDRLRGRGVLSEDDINDAMREIRIALLEADVALPVVKDFIGEVKTQALGSEVLRSVTPGQMVVKIVHDHLVALLGSDASELNLRATPPAVILMVGLQGSGKTTSSAKLAKFLGKSKKVLMASLDIYRPAAMEQLQILGQQIQVATVPIVAGEKPDAITKRALKMGREEGFDVLILDTAGRLHLDETLMQEVAQVRDIAKPVETLLVADAMTGQDAVVIAKSFQEKIGITGLILTRLDGDGRGGAALSMKAVTGCPIKFAGMGEKVGQLEVFHPGRVADRILGMGDVVSLVEKAAENIDQEAAEKLAKRMEKGLFDFNDMAAQLDQMGKMGGLSGIMGMLPGAPKIKDKLSQAGMDDGMIGRQVAIIRSMTLKERRDAHLMNASRKKRIAAGSGTSVQDVNRLLKQFQEMQTMMKRMKKLGKAGLMRQGMQALFNR